MSNRNPDAKLQAKHNATRFTSVVEQLKIFVCSMKDEFHREESGPNVLGMLLEG